MTSNVKRKMTHKKVVSYTVIYIILIIISIICAGPFIWLFLTSLKSGENIYALSFFHPTLTNYIGVIEFMNFAKYFMNTLIITIGAILIDILFSSMCAYPLACMDFPGKKAVFNILLSAMILPAAAGLVITYLTVVKLHLLNTFLGVILPMSVGAFSIVLMRQAYLNVPKDLMDAARIDGASELRVWWQIMMPGIKPTITTIIIFDFIGNWNNFLWPIIILQDPAKYPIATALQYLNGQFNYKFGYIAAGTIISIIPVIIIFLIFQKNYIEAVSGAVKG